MTRKISFVCLVLTACLLFSGAANDLPVIGILSIPSEVDGHPPGNYSYMPASYVKFMESAGARVIPIPYDASPENITFLLGQVNGVLFIGGGAALTETDPETGEVGFSNLTKVGIQIVKHVLETNAKGEHFPLMGTCLGWELLLISLAGRYDIFYTQFNDHNVNTPVMLTPDAKTSKLWNTLTPELQLYAQRFPAFFYSHSWGILPEKFNSLKGITDVLKMTSVSRPVNGGPTFVSSGEGIEYPIYGNQFHPEKNQFEWKPQIHPAHTPESIDITQRMANLFVNEARKNNRKFLTDDVLNGSLIYNWVPQQTNKWMQVYTFSTVAQDPKSWPALFNTKRVVEKNPAL